jgi:putative FmdB family regulatory protein
MPIYEYRCDKCGKTFEKIQKFADAPVEVHEDCGGHVERLVSAPAFQFKGSGFYITDYAKGSGGATGKIEHKGGESKGDSKSESHSDSKSESKSSESKSSDSKSSESKSSESKSDSKSESKSESKPAPASKPD